MHLDVKPGLILDDQTSADMCDDIFTSYQTSDSLTADSLTVYVSGEKSSCSASADAVITQCDH